MDTPTSTSSRMLEGASTPAGWLEKSRLTVPSVTCSSEKLESKLLSPSAVASLMIERGLNTLFGLLRRTAVDPLVFD